MQCIDSDSIPRFCAQTQRQAQGDADASNKASWQVKEIPSILWAAARVQTEAKDGVQYVHCILHRHQPDQLMPASTSIRIQYSHSELPNHHSEAQTTNLLLQNSKTGTSFYWIHSFGPSTRFWTAAPLFAVFWRWTTVLWGQA